MKIFLNEDIFPHFTQASVLHLLKVVGKKTTLTCKKPGREHASCQAAFREE